MCYRCPQTQQEDILPAPMKGSSVSAVRSRPWGGDVVKLKSVQAFGYG